MKKKSLILISGLLGLTLSCSDSALFGYNKVPTPTSKLCESNPSISCNPMKMERTGFSQVIAFPEDSFGGNSSLGISLIGKDISTGERLDIPVSYEILDPRTISISIPQQDLNLFSNGSALIKMILRDLNENRPIWGRTIDVEIMDVQPSPSL